MKSLLVLFAMFLAACSTSQDEMTQNETTQLDMAQETTTEETQQLQDSGTNEVSLVLGEKIIENAYLRYETTNFEDSISFVNEQVEVWKGIVEYSHRSQAQDGVRSGDYVSMTIRIPQENLHAFIEDMDHYDPLFLSSQEISRQDVTQQYRDNETRIAVFKEEEAALRELMQEQGSLEEILQIRTRLTEIISEREIFENQNQMYDEQMAYSTIHLEVQQSDRASDRDLGGFWDRLIHAIVDSFYAFIHFMQDLVIGLVYFTPHIIVFGLLGYIIYRAIKNRGNNK